MMKTSAPSRGRFALRSTVARHRCHARQREASPSQRPRTVPRAGPRGSRHMTAVPTTANSPRQAGRGSSFERRETEVDHPPGTSRAWYRDRLGVAGTAISRRHRPRRRDCPVQAVSRGAAASARSVPGGRGAEGDRDEPDREARRVQGERATEGGELQPTIAAGPMNIPLAGASPQRRRAGAGSADRYGTNE